MFSAMQSHLARGARRAAWATAGGGLLAVGTAFLTVAAWLVLSETRDAQFAALVIGLFYVGVGLVALALGTKRTSKPPATAAAPLTPQDGQQDVFERIAAAFGEGFQTGKAMKRASSRAP